MDRVAILEIRHGNFQQGFEVSLEIKEDQGQTLAKLEGKLPANTYIENLYQSWQQSFYRVTGIERNDGWENDYSLPENVATSDLVTDCRQKVQSLEANIQLWLQPSADINWQKIRERLAQELARHSQGIRLIIAITKEELLWKLPWHVWDLLSDYPDVGIGYSTNENYPPPKSISFINKARILAVFGDNKNIDLTEDLQIINNLRNTELFFLDQPQSRELIQNLRGGRGWDIFFFAGHSQTENNVGQIYLNEREILEIEQFKNALTEAIRKGLKIAIFNSCDGLKLAQGLVDLHIPVVIVMQEIVPDLVAQSFLKEFLTEYNSGQPLYTAVRRAQARLEEFTDYPGATWLPLIFQNPTVKPPIWRITNQPCRWDLLGQVALSSLMLTGLVMGVRWFGILQPLELYAYDRLIQLRFQEKKTDTRLLVVTIDNSDINYQHRQDMNMSGSLSDEALFKALDELEKLKPTTIALDIYRRNGFDSSVSNRVKEDHRFFAICKIPESENNRDNNGVKPPHNFPEKRLGFSDVPVDEDRVVRRQFLDMTPPYKKDLCPTQLSLSFLVALHYLDRQENIQAKYTSEKEWQLDNIVFNKLTNHSSGYQRLDDSGYQILLNYRGDDDPHKNVRSISLEDLLEKGISPNSVAQMQETIVLIGTIDRNYRDYHLTPYGTEVAGVFLQAQMVSQIISAVLDNRTLLWKWQWWLEAIWIWGWSIIGGILATYISHRWRLMLTIIVSLTGLFCISLIVFNYGLWIPLIPPSIALLLTVFTIKKTIRHLWKSKVSNINKGNLDI